jgi:hypothetical protein
MSQSREPFVEPEIVKHEEKMADVTAQAGSGVLTDSAADGAPGPIS